jgi:hypothetical protein
VYGSNGGLSNRGRPKMTIFLEPCAKTRLPFPRCGRWAIQRRKMAGRGVRIAADRLLFRGGSTARLSQE